MERSLSIINIRCYKLNSALIPSRVSRFAVPLSFFITKSAYGYIYGHDDLLSSS